VRSWATEVRLRLPDTDQKHLQHLAALHRREQTTLLERRMEQDKRAYLKDDVFATPGSAAVWWLVNHPGEVENAVGLLGTLSELSAAATDLAAGRSSAEAIDRPQPTRAELAFSAAVDDLAEEDDAESPTDESQQRSVPRHADAQQTRDHTPSGRAKSDLNGSAAKSTEDVHGEYREQFSSE